MTQTLLKHIRLRSAAALVVANIIGAGIFTTTGFQAADLGNPLTIFALWIVGGVLAYCGALCYAELGAAMPERKLATCQPSSEQALIAAPPVENSNAAPRIRARWSAGRDNQAVSPMRYSRRSLPFRWRINGACESVRPVTRRHSSSAL